MMKKIFLGILLFMMVINSATAVTWVHDCLNDTHMIKEAKPTFDSISYEWNQTIYCEYNCSSEYNECNPAPKDRPSDDVFIAIVIGFGLVAMAFFYLFAKTTKQGYEGLQILFMILGFLSIIGLLNILLNVAQETSSKSAVVTTIESMYNFASWSIWIILLYIIVYMILYYFGYVGNKIDEAHGK